MNHAQPTSKKRLKTLDLAYIGASVALITVCSWITVPLPAVPITLQTLGVCTVAGLFGAKRGALSVAVYVLLAALGVPVLSGFSGGIGAILGPTGGYIIGFILTALIVGFVSDKANAKLLPTVVAMCGGVLICYAAGTAWFAWVYAKRSDPASLHNILLWCVYPFIPFDALKIAVSAILTNRLRRFIR